MLLKSDILVLVFALIPCAQAVPAPRGSSYAAEHGRLSHCTNITFTVEGKAPFEVFHA